MLKQLFQRKKSKYVIFIVLFACLSIGGLIFFYFAVVQNKFGIQIEPEMVENLEGTYLKTFGEEGYVKSATYFGDEWPINFWNSEMDNLQADMQQLQMKFITATKHLKDILKKFQNFIHQIIFKFYKKAQILFLGVFLYQEGSICI